MEMEDEQRNELLHMDIRQMYVVGSIPILHMLRIRLRRCRRDVAKFVNSYPTLDVSYTLAKGEYTAGAPIFIQVVLSRDADEEDPDDQIVVAPFYPVKKMSNWWLVVGEPSTRQLHVIKRVTISKRLVVKLEFTLPKGAHSLKLYVICDSYVGADHDLSLDPIEVAEGEESDSDEDEDESGDDAMEE